jgi:hypothetical protein
MTDNADMPSSGYNLCLTWLARLQMQRSGITLPRIYETMSSPDAVVDHDRKSVYLIKLMEPYGIMIKARHSQELQQWSISAVWLWHPYAESPMLLLKFLRLPYRLLGRLLAGAA